jgi:hypothetical protein
MTWQLFDRQVAHPLDGKRGSKSLENRERQRKSLDVQGFKGIILADQIIP